MISVKSRDRRKVRPAAAGNESMKREHLIYIILLLMICATASFAQVLPTPMTGRRFIVAFPDTTTHILPSAMRGEFPEGGAFMIFVSADTTNVTVRAGGGSPVVKTVRVTPSESAVLSVGEMMDRTTPFLDRIDTALRRTFDVRSERPISMYMYFFTPYGSEAFTPLAVESWGTEYRVATFPSTLVWHVDPYQELEETIVPIWAATETVVIASEDSTEVTIAPNSGTAGKERIVILNAGEAYQIQSDTILPLPYTTPPAAVDYVTRDLSGTRITSTKPIGVISGNTRAPSERGGIAIKELGWLRPNTLNNAALEWIFPVNLHGRTFSTERITSFHPDSSNEIIRVYATSPGTTRFTTSREDTVDVVQGRYHEFHSSPYLDGISVPSTYRAPMTIESSLPAQAVVLTGPYAEQKPLAPGFTEIITTSQASSLLLPFELWYSTARFHAPREPDFLRHWVAITAEKSAQLRLDGEPITLSSLPSEAYAHGLIEVEAGDHIIVANHGVFNAIAYGTATGYQAYRPLATKEPGSGGSAPQRGSGGGPRVLHPSQYYETPGLTYAYPVAGTIRPWIEMIERCTDADAFLWDMDSSLFRQILMEIDSAGGNVEVLTEVRSEIMGGYPTAYVHIGFRPINPEADARADVRVICPDTMWTIPYRYSAKHLQATPDSVGLVDVPPGVTTSTKMTLGNISPRPIVIRSVRLMRDYGDDGGFRVTTLPPKGTMESGAVGSFTITFKGLKEATLYTDSLLVETDCGIMRIPLSARTADRSLPYPEIGGFDAGERWVTDASPCTKSGIPAYDTVVAVRNIGSVAYTVRSIELVGPDADAGYFRLDYSDPARAVFAGTVIDPEMSDPALHLQKILFRPDEERNYTCVVRLTTEDGDTAESVLNGTGIESHVSVSDHDFGTVVLDASNSATATGSVTLTAGRSRRLTVTGLAISGPDASGFRFAPDFVDTLPTPASPWILEPGDRIAVRLEFVPVHMGVRSAFLEVFGDHAFCDDSTGLLTGRAGNADVRGAALSVATGCPEDTAYIMVRNDGGEDFRITEMTLLDPAGVFRMGPSPAGRIVRGGDSLPVAVYFSSDTDGVFTAKTIFTLTSSDGSRSLGSVAGTITGAAWTLVVNAHVDRNISGFPGSVVMVPVVLDSQIDTAGVTEFTLLFMYDRRIARVAGVYPGSALSGKWRVEVLGETGGEPSGMLIRMISTDGSTVKGTGSLVDLSFHIFLGEIPGSDVGLTITLPAYPCARITAVSGHMRIDSICGLDQRLIKVDPVSYALNDGRPNPFNPSTEIIYSIGLEAHTRMTIHDAAGAEVARPVDALLSSGTYSVVWDATRFPSGLYFCRIRSGSWSAVRPLLLLK